VVIRHAVPADAVALRRFTCHRADEPWTLAPEVIVTSQVPNWIRVNGATVLVAERRGEIVGVIAVTAHPSDARSFTSQVLAVDHQHRRQYIGYSLKLRALEIVTEAGARFVSSEVDVENIAMRRCNDCFEATAVPAPHEPETLITVIRPTP
jgi:ribosomal protein S18 acetylase RimI-like enzyme